MNDIDMKIVRDRMTQKRKEKKITMNDLAEAAGVSKSTLEKWLYGNKFNDITGKYEPYHISIDKAYNIAQALGVSIAYLIGEIESEHAENKDISNLTGLSDNAIECLRIWKQFSQQACFPGSFNDLETLNTLLEYYYEQNKANKGLLPPFSIFHSIGMYLEAPDFDLMSPGGKDTLNNTMDVINHKNKLAHYNIPVAGLVREYVKDKIIDALKNISLHVCKS